MYKISPELTLNWNQTGIKLVPSTSWAMEEQGIRMFELVGLNDKFEVSKLNVQIFMDFVVICNLIKNYRC